MMVGLLVVATGTLGVALLVTAGAPRPGFRLAGRAGATQRWMTQAGLADVRPRSMALAVILCGGAGAVVTWAVFGSAPAAAGGAVFAACAPPAVHRQRRRQRMEVAQDAWPQMLEEIRVLCTSAGRSIPTALLEVGRRGPVELRPAFEAAHREWVLSTDFGRTVAVLTRELASPSADLACETLLVAYEVGSHDLDRRLAELAEDRRRDATERKDARARQAGARFARRFVVLVPLGMALAGLSMGRGREAYTTPTGQLLVVAGIGLVALCWVWSGRILRLPDEARVLS